MQKYSLIEFQEDEQIPLKVIVEDKESKFQLAQPLSIEITTLVNHISDFSKRILQEDIEMWSGFSMIMQQTQNFNEFQKKLKNQETQQFNNFDQSVTDFIFGGHFPKKSETQYYNFQIFMRNMLKLNNPEDERIQQKEKNIKSNVAILIYQGESLENLNNSISYFTDRQIIPIVIITRRKHFKQLSTWKFDENLYYKAYVPLYKNYSSSKNHAFLFEEHITEQIVAYYFAFFKELDQIQLIKWIYLGILSFIDPEFVVISQSNQEFICQIQTYFPLISEENKIFGIQWFDQLQIEDQKLKNLSYYLQIPQSIINSHSIFKIKQFHNPFQCIYKWSLINNYISNYYKLTQQKNIGSLELNSILPKLMFESEQLELLVLKEHISISKIIQNSEDALINYFMDIRQKIQNQMQNHEIITTNLKIYIFSTFQNFFCKFQFIQGYFSISICFFFSFYSPYQLINQITEQSLFQIALVIIIPLFYLFNVIIFTLLSNLYHFQDKVQFKNAVNKISYILNYNQSDQIKVSSSVDRQDFYISETLSQQNSLINLKIEVEQDDLILDFERPLSRNNENNQEIILQAHIPQTLNINQIFMNIISIQKILDFTVFAFTFTNFIIVYGKCLWDQSVIYQSCIFFLVIFLILIEFFQKGFNLLAYTFNFSFLTYFWQIQNVNNKQYSPQFQLATKKQLAELLLSNAVVSYCFTAVESYFNYSGYIFLGILGYLTLVSVISGILQIIFYKNSQLENEPNVNNERKEENQSINSKLENQHNNFEVNNERQEENHQQGLKFCQSNREELLKIAREFVNYLKKYQEEKDQDKKLKSQEGQQSQEQQQQNLDQNINKQNEFNQQSSNNQSKIKQEPINTSSSNQDQKFQNKDIKNQSNQPSKSNQDQVEIQVFHNNKKK